MFDLTTQEIEDIAKTAVDMFDEHDAADYRNWQFTELLREEVMSIRARRAMTAKPNRSESAEIKEWLDSAIRVYGFYAHPIRNWRDGK